MTTPIGFYCPCCKATRDNPEATPQNARGEWRALVNHHAPMLCDACLRAYGPRAAAPPGPGRRDAAKIEGLVTAYGAAHGACSALIERRGHGIISERTPEYVEAMRLVEANRSALLAAIAALSAGVPAEPTTTIVYGPTDVSHDDGPACVTDGEVRIGMPCPECGRRVVGGQVRWREEPIAPTSPETRAEGTT